MVRACTSQVKVVYKRPSDLAIMRDVPIYCNLCITDILDDGLLTSGIIPAFKHALSNLLLSDAILMPASATVYMQVRINGFWCGNTERIKPRKAQTVFLSMFRRNR